MPEFVCTIRFDAQLRLAQEQKLVREDDGVSAPPSKPPLEVASASSDGRDESRRSLWVGQQLSRSHTPLPTVVAGRPKSGGAAQEFEIGSEDEPPGIEMEAAVALAVVSNGKVEHGA